MAKPESDELHYLRWFFANADFGPGDGDVRAYLNERYEEQTGRKVPDGYGVEE